jgi:cell division protein ZapE
VRRLTPLAELAAQVGSEPPAAVPPPRFSQASFSGYLPTHPSQAEACRAVREFVAGESSQRSRWRWPWRSNGNGAPQRREGLYLDGGYGVGKTHLLAAAFHAAPDGRKAYLTFQELVHLIGAMGMEAARNRFATVSLICLDEFELDDPGNTLIVKRFLEGLFAAGGKVITTSNTPPEAQGQGRFNAEDFRREIQGIAAHFRTLCLEGSDYRHRDHPVRLLQPDELAAELARDDAPVPVVGAGFEELLDVLRELHPIRYRPLLASIGTLVLHDVRTLASQGDALRFVHFIDQLYDRRVRLRAAGEVALTELFDPAYRHSAYQKKHERCVSRLGELLEEPLASITGDEEREQGASIYRGNGVDGKP